jgi:hypothetical protein
MKRVVWGCGALLLLLVVGRDFMVATTFLGDDYVFRAFAQLEPNPFVAFVADKHGGEYYRPIPMLLWWLLERVGGGAVWPFALSAFLLHCTCAVLLAVVARRLLLTARTSLLAGALFFAAPAEREAALWFSANTDLLATAASLGTIAFLLSDRRAGRLLSWVVAGFAFFSKETALVLPFLLVSILWYLDGATDRQPGRRFHKIATRTVRYWALAAVYLVVRTIVLGGIGGSNDVRAPFWAVAVQIAAGCVHAVSAHAPLPEWAAWLVGASALVTAAVVCRRSRLAILALLWVALAVLPLPAAGWVVGARYFYLCAAALWLLVAVALERVRLWLSLVAVAALAALGMLAVDRRSSEIALYREAVAAAKDAVRDGSAKGHRLFLVRGAVKDLDLAVKLDPAMAALAEGIVVIPDVPASFVRLPRAGTERLGFLFAEPPLPPSGAYRFGAERIVGLARREEAPDLDEVLDRLPDLRIVRLKLDVRPVGWQDITADYLAR